MWFWFVTVVLKYLNFSNFQSIGQLPSCCSFVVHSIQEQILLDQCHYQWLIKLLCSSLYYACFWQVNWYHGHRTDTEMSSSVSGFGTRLLLTHSEGNLKNTGSKNLLAEIICQTGFCLSRLYCRLPVTIF